MISFGTQDVRRYAARQHLFRRVDIIYFTLIVLIVILCAVLSAIDNQFERVYEGAYIALLVIDIAAIIAYVLFNIFGVFRNARLFKRHVTAILYGGLNARPELFAGENVQLEVSYAGDAITIVNGGESQLIDLTALKKSAEVYAYCGQALYDYLRAYYSEACKSGFDGDVLVIDRTGKKQETFCIITHGKEVVPCKDAGKILARASETTK